VDYSLYLIPSNTCFRERLSIVVSSTKFDYMILVFIFASCIQLVLENPLTDPDGQLMEILFYIDIGFTCLFGIEAVLKIMAFGFLLNGKQSYLRNYWNILDFIIIFFSIISISFPSLNLEVLKVLRLLRVLRPLRFISKNEGLQVAIRALFKGIPDIFNVIIIACLFLLIFSIIGVNFFKGLYFEGSETIASAKTT